MPTTAIGALAVDPADDRVLYAGTGEANFANHSRYGLGIAKTTDGGATWKLYGEQVFGGRCISRIRVDPTTRNVVYAAVTHAGGFPALVAARGHPRAKGPLGVFKSTDGGVTWKQVGKGLPNVSITDLALDPANPKVLYAAAGHIFGSSANGIYKSTDGGLTFTKLTKGLPAYGVGRIALALAPSNPKRLYALFVRAATATGSGAYTLGIYRSDDAGATWTLKTTRSFQASYGWYLCVLTVHPKNPDLVFAGGFSMLRSNNGGTSWWTVTPPHVDLHAIEFDASGRLWAGDDGGVHLSATLGSSWSARNTGLGIVQFYAGISLHPTVAALVLGGAQDNGSLQRTNGKSWTRVFGGDGGCTGIDPSGRTRFVEYQGTGNLYRSVGGGYFRRSSFGIYGRNCFLPPFAIDPSNGSRMIYGTERVFLSVNGGASWRAISGDLTNGGSAAINGLEIAPSNGKYIYVRTNDGNVQVSEDGGTTWSLRRKGVPGWPRTTRPFAVDPRDPKRVYLAVGWFGTDQVLFSSDAGRTWSALDGVLPDLPVHCLALDARAPGPPVIYAGTDAGVFRTDDHGYSWFLYGEGLPNCPVVDLRLDSGRNRLVAATQGRGCWLLPLHPKGSWPPKTPGGE